MEWRAQSAVSCDEAFSETRRWIEAVTKKKFGSTDFRSALENGVLLCDLINKIKPGIIKRVNRLPTPIAGLDNLNVFLKACGKLGLKEAQLFHPGDLQDLSTRVTVKHQETNRRLKNVLITIYWLGRRAQCDRFYDGPYLNFKAFEGLLGTALYKALQETSSQKGNNVRDSGFGDSWYSEREELHHLKEGGGGGGHKRDDSLDSLDSLGSQPRSISSDTTLKGGSEGCCSDTEADSGFRMADNKDHVSYRRSVAITPKASTPFNQFLPSKDKSSGYVPAPLRKKRAERNEDSRRSWGPMYTEDEGPLTRQRQMRESIDGSKSTSDIQVDPSVIRQARYEELQKYRDKIKDSEDQWQDDLSKWKSRRKSVNSDIVKKKEEREKIEQITYSSSSSSNRRSKTFKEMQEERENKGTNSIGGRLKSLSYLDDEDVFEKPVITPRTRTLPPRSYTIDTPYYSSEPPEPSPKEVEPPAASPAIGRAASPPTSLEVDTVERPAGSDATTAVAPTASSRSFSHRSQSPEAAPLQSCPVSEHTTAVETEKTTTIVSSSSSAVQKAPEPRRPLSVTQAEVEAPSSGSLYKQQPQLGSMEPKPPGVSRVSASLPRSYQRSDSARLTSVVTPRPFGTQTSRLTSLPRAFTLDDSHKRVNGDVAAVSKKSSVPTRYHQFMTSEDEAEAQSSSTHSSEDEEEEEEAKEEKSETVSSTTQSVSPVPPPVKSEAPLGPPAKESSQESYCEMRVSLNQKPNSSKDFGFQAAWDSTGARVTSIQPGSQAEMCQLRAGDEVLSVNRHKVAEMSYTDWKSCMEEALQEGSLVMDIRRHGKNNWDRHPPSLPFKSHKTINLTSTDHPALLGSPDANAVKPSLDFTSRMSREIQLPPTKEAPAQPAVDAASNGVNGGFGEETVTMRNKESEPISLKNLKRRSEFFEQGGSESAMPDIPVPAITPSSSRWSWDPEEERRRQEKWQKEQERILQEKYKRDQEKLHEEWLKAQQEITTSSEQQEPARLNSHSVSPRSPLSPVNQPATPPPWEEEERKRKEEQERLRQAEERRKREEEERELQRLQEERQRKERQEEEERKKRQEEELRWQRRREEEREEERRRQEAFEQQRRERERAFEQQQQRAVSHVQAPLSHADRTKSKSSPQLDEPQPKGVHVPPLGMAQWLLEEQLKIACDKEAQSQRAASELEMERRNILNAMRYREPERAVTGSGLLFERKGQQPGSQAEAERQQILNEMKKKTPVLTDSSWIRQRSTTTPYTKEADVPPMRRGESLDNLDSYNSWRSSWTPRSNSHVQNYTRPHSALSGSTSFYGGGSMPQRPGSSSTLPSSYSMGSLRGGAGTPSSPWSRQSPSPSHSSPSPTPSEPTSEVGASQQRSRSVSGKKICTFCDAPLGKGAAMIIESLGLCYHLSCFKCIDCKSDLGGSEAGAEVRIRHKQLYCNSCYMRFKTGQPTPM
ncbi:LIM domain only protein 7 isoform X1 [Larimichthys crocea]|uniref:LIM domain only protein 7 isoform X1 n=2 Tax=Larimichthys crocea TaxID=215358 RepID=UPI000F5FBC58|nr:LIM domain only protein 7 isoform X1 [Larimichthys crocea]XP_027146667.1 LIM domain only protein 7 isoform X1 [Larimichthys crocea]